MTDGRFKDFDGFWEENGRGPVKLKVFGTEHTLPSDLPANLALKLGRINEDIRAGRRSKEELLGDEELRTIAVGLFGEKIYDAWLDNGIGIGQLDDVISWVLEQYGPETGGGEEGEDKAPKTGATSSEPSSSDGPSSKPISTASIPGSQPAATG